MSQLSTEAGVEAVTRIHALDSLLSSVDRAVALVITQSSIEHR